MDIWTLKEVLLNEVYTTLRPIPQNGIIVDIGSGIGDFCILASKPACHVFGYDPDPNRAQLCRKNLKLNSVKNVTIHQHSATSLSQIFLENKLSRIDFLKIDCEGCEYPILLNAKSLTLKKVAYLAAEIHLFNQTTKQQFAALQKHLVRTGFQYTIQPNPVHQTICYLYAHHPQRASS